MMVVLVGCGAPASTPTPIQPTEEQAPASTSTQEPVAEFEVTFDGINCTVSGPSDLLSGSHSFALFDSSDIGVDLWVGRLEEGRTVQDLYDGQSQPGEWYPKPSWFFYDKEVGSAWMNNDGAEVWTYSLNQQGEHVVYVGVYLPDVKHLWFCPQTISIQATSD
jgi:hypothetical protein